MFDAPVKNENGIADVQKAFDMISLRDSIALVIAF